MMDCCGDDCVAFEHLWSQILLGLFHLLSEVKQSVKLCLSLHLYKHIGKGFSELLTTCF